VEVVVNVRQQLIVVEQVCLVNDEQLFEAQLELVVMVDVHEVQLGQV
jgi:hypothetical protein